MKAWIGMAVTHFLLSKTLIILLCLLCVGCIPDRDVPTTTVVPPESFSANGEKILPQRWWLSFADPALDRLMARALAGNLPLKAARDRLDQAEAIAVKAGAERFPAGSLEASGARAWRDQNGANVTQNNFLVGFRASYELDFWGRVRSGSAAANLDALARAEDLNTAGIILSSQVADTWYSWLEQNGLQLLLNEQLETNGKILELVTLQFRTGQAGVADVLQQRQLVEAGRGELALAAARTRVLEHLIDVLAGEPPGSRVAGSASAPVALPPLPSTGVPAELLQRRPDVRSAWFRLQAADQRVAAAIADRFPRISLSGRVETSADQVNVLFQDWLSTLAANLVAPLFDGGRRLAEVDRASAAAAEALHDYGQTILVALAEVEDALVRERKQNDYLASLDKQLELARLAEASLRDRHIQGTVDYQRVLTARLSTQSLQRRHLTARRELFGTRIALCRALAGGWNVASGE